MGEAGAQREGKLSWPVVLLTLTAIVSSSISALCLCQLSSLRTEVDAIKSEVGRRREEGPENRVRDTTNPFLENKQTEKGRFSLSEFLPSSG